jgi:hypothetical protein
MQRLSVGTRPRSALLFVRRVSDLPRTLQMVNALIALRSSAGAPSDAVLGVVVGVDPDHEPTRRPVGSDVTVIESAALSGVWSLCWFEAWSVGGFPDAGSRRRRLLDSLVIRGPGLAGGDGLGRRVLFPVLTRAEAAGEVHVLINVLRDDYPTLTIGETFVHDPARGGVVRLEGVDEAVSICQPS